MTDVDLIKAVEQEDSGMNLYWVYICESEWGCYCFAHSPNKAKMLVAHEFDVKHTDMRYKTLEKGVNVSFEAAVSCEEQPEYEHVKRCGFEYAENEEDEYGW